jgi:hypothetical protein
MTWQRLGNDRLPCNADMNGIVSTGVSGKRIDMTLMSVGLYTQAWPKSVSEDR